MSVCIWNCRGVGKKGFSTLIRDLKFRFRIDVFVLLETGISGLKGDRIIKQFGFPSFFKQEAIGFSGGIWILWDDKVVKIEIILAHHQFIHTQVQHLASGKSEIITFVYRSPRRLERKNLWNELEAFSSSIQEAWLLIGDFNSILHASEKTGGSDLCWDSISDMQQSLINCKISDIGYKGPEFTWKRGKLHERLDRGCSNEEWNVLWPNRFISHLPFFNSDHRPLLLAQSGPPRPREHSKPFKFMAAWLTDQDFGRLVMKSWGSNEEWVPARNNFEKDATVWHQNVFKRNIQQKNKIYARLRGLDSYMNGRFDHSLEILQKNLWKELQAILIKEELTWFQRSRSQWLKYGDRNTRFFHSSTVARRRHNRILTLKDENGTWIADPDSLVNMAVSYYKELFTAETPDDGFFPIQGMFPSLSEGGKEKTGPLS
ncbi:uncharacterized protein LOC133294726 [Gastrolobium bilobum]|uniref:uncharacterized protein LOC133294726 n=1 Tax=Gastrolobium bilobum TaxID=150636 RepID=UPI002AB15892|nr:uncharacterized protein LOC133294726 [Gastrolobium bilobum]